MRVVRVGCLFLLVALVIVPRTALAQSSSPPAKPLLEADGYDTGSIFLRWWPVFLLEHEIHIERKSSGDWIEIARNVFHTNEHVDKDLPAATVFSYRARVLSANGFSEYSNEVTVKVPSGPLSGPPEVPALKFDGVTPHAVPLKWTAVEYVSSCSLERKIGSGDWSVIAYLDGATVSFEDELVHPSTTYSYRMRAQNSYGYSPYSAEVLVTTLAGPPAIPRAPELWGFSNGKATSLFLKWYEIHNATGYILEAKTGVDGAWAQVADISAPATEYTHTNLTALTTYHYRLRAYNESGASDHSNEFELTTNAPPPETPVLSATVLSYKEIDLHWNKVARDYFTSYVLQRKWGETWSDLATLGSNTINYFSSGFQSSTEYSFRIMARNTAGTSQWSYVTVTTPPRPEIPPQAPLLFADSISHTEVRLKWNYVELVNEFRVERKNPAGQWEEIAVLPEYTLSHTNSGLQPKTSYAYRVRALNSHGSSPYSNEAGAITPQRPEIPILSGWSNSQSEIELFWSDSYGAERYTVERRATSGEWVVVFQTASEPFRFYDRGLATDTYYSYRLAAHHFSGELFYSSELTLATYPHQLFDPPQLSATAISSSAISLSWPPLEHATYYYLDKLVGDQWTTLHLEGNVTNYVDEGLSPGSSYTYRIQGRNGLGGSLYSRQLTTSTHLAISGEIIMRTVELSTDRLRIQLLGSTGQRFKIQRSSDFQTWNDASDTMSLSGGMNVEIEVDPNAALNFYRTLKID